MTTSPRKSDLESLIIRIERIAPLASSLKCQAYRSTSPRYATETDLLTGEGGRKSGGRWNPRGLTVIYACLTPQTAMEESLANVRYYKWPVQTAMPRTFVAISFDLKRVLDLTSGDIRRRLGFSQKRLLETDWRAEVSTGNVPLTQALGQAASNVGLEALLVPSAAEPNGKNIVAFPQNFKKSSSVVVLAPDKL